MATMVDVGLIEVNSRTLKRIEDNNEARKEGLTARDETSVQQRYTQLGCAVCRIIRYRDSYCFD
jgi:hypothetical protein